MRQEYKQYTDEHQEVWRVLFERQQNNLITKAVLEYNNCLQELSPVLNASQVPHFEYLNEVLKSKTGWEIKVVPGLIPAAEFLSLLSEKKFCSSTWLRSMEQLDYLEEPDMFHDIFGHVPLLMNNNYSNFMQQLGELGKKYAHSNSTIELLERFYWYTIEFGVVNVDEGMKIYGAGIISSFQETNSLSFTQTEVQPYDFEKIVQSNFLKNTLQSKYYALPKSIDSLYESLNSLKRMIEVDSQVFAY